MIGSSRMQVCDVHMELFQIQDLYFIWFEFILDRNIAFTLGHCFLKMNPKKLTNLSKFHHFFAKNGNFRT